jgi:hypothetical protein
MMASLIAAPSLSTTYTSKGLAHFGTQVLEDRHSLGELGEREPSLLVCDEAVWVAVKTRAKHTTLSQLSKSALTVLPFSVVPIAIT